MFYFEFGEKSKLIGFGLQRNVKISILHGHVEIFAKDKCQGDGLILFIGTFFLRIFLLFKKKITLRPLLNNPSTLNNQKCRIFPEKYSPEKIWLLSKNSYSFLNLTFYWYENA